MARSLVLLLLLVGLVPFTLTHPGNDFEARRKAEEISSTKYLQTKNVELQNAPVVSAEDDDDEEIAQQHDAEEMIQTEDAKETMQNENKQEEIVTENVKPNDKEKEPQIQHEDKNKKPEEVIKEVKLENDNGESANKENKRKTQVEVDESKIKNVQQSTEAEEEQVGQPQGRVLYNGSQLWKVAADTDAKKKVLGKLRDGKHISMWGGNKTAVDILVKAESKKIVKETLEQNNISHYVIIEDIQRAIDEENPIEDEDSELADRKGHRMTWDSYHRLEDIHGYLDYLAETYPNLCSVKTIGKSVQGRDLKVLKISNGRAGNKAIWIDGGMHAREWISPATVTYIINHLVLSLDNEPGSLKNLDWYFLPVANPDGYEYSHTTDRLWRKNRARGGQCTGTDLNRNYGYKWGGKGNGRFPCQEIYGGTGPFSEPETQAIKNFIMGPNRPNWKASISFHSYGQYILYPWGYDRVVPPDHKDLEQVARKAASAIQRTSGSSYTVGPAANTLYPAAGGSDDWAKGAVGIKYAYTIELRDNGRYGFILPASYIQPTAKEGLAATKIIAEAASTA